MFVCERRRGQNIIALTFATRCPIAVHAHLERSRAGHSSPTHLSINNEKNTLPNSNRCTACAKIHTRSCRSAPVIGSCISKILWSLLRTCCAAAWRFLGADGAPLRGTTTTTFRGGLVRRAIEWLVRRDAPSCNKAFRLYRRYRQSMWNHTV